ncbi:MAG: hypothetical protein HKN60_09440, partial [Rhizobiales bacterium]|nr:hypothetical protein [Hyphomicrobiales bacterium]
MTDTGRLEPGRPASGIADARELGRARAARRERIARYVLPVVILGMALFCWDRIVVWNEIPHYILPRPGLV